MLRITVTIYNGLTTIKRNIVLILKWIARVFKWFFMILIAGIIVLFFVVPDHIDPTPRLQATTGALYAENYVGGLMRSCWEGDLKAGIPKEKLGPQEINKDASKYLQSFVVRAMNGRTGHIILEYGKLTFDWRFGRFESVPPGKTLIFEFRCTEEQKLERKIIGGTLPKKYWPRIFDRISE